MTNRENWEKSDPEKLRKMAEADYAVPEPLNKKFKSVLLEIAQACEMKFDGRSRARKMLHKRSEFWTEVYQEFFRATGRDPNVAITVDDESLAIEIGPKKDQE